MLPACNDKVALITGVSGQDGWYLSRLLVEQGYAVHGIRRRSSHAGTPKEPLPTRPAAPSSTANEISNTTHGNSTANEINNATPDATVTGSITYHFGDLLDPIGLRRIISETQPAEVYNLAAQSHVATSFQDPIYTANVVAMGTLNLLEALRDYRDATGREVRFYQASSSEIFGAAPTAPQNEQTPVCPHNPYACAKAHAFWQTAVYRDAYRLFACNGILYNHESPRRGEQYVTRKITRAAARIKLGLQDVLVLGNLEARRDWGFAGDYVRAMWLMLQQPVGDDYLIATGQTHSIRELLEIAFAAVELDWRDYVRVDRGLFRPTEPRLLCGDARKARQVLGWQPTVTFEQLIHMMVEHDVRLAERDRVLCDAGYA